MPTEIVKECARLIAEKKLTIAFAESATAGNLSYQFSLTPESGEILKGGLVCYDANIKEDILGIEPGFIEKYTPESAEVTRELAQRLNRVIKRADIFVAVTGLTTPGGSENPEKPVGTMFIHAVIKDRDFTVREVFSGSAEEIVTATVDRVARLLIENIT